MQRLRDYMRANEVTQGELARRLGVKQPTVWEWIHGKTKPSAASLVLLSQETGLSIDELLREST